MSHSGTPVPSQAKEKTSVVEDFIDIFYAPAAVFARRASGGFWIPAIVITLFVGLMYIGNAGAMESIMDAEFERGAAAAMRANPQITPEMMQKGRDFATTTGKIGIFVIMPITMALIGLMLWVAGKLVDAKQTVAAALMVGAYSYMPRVVESILAAAQGFLLDTSKMNSRYQITLSAARFFDPDKTSPMLLAIMGRFDLMTIWVTVLLAIGLAVTGNIPRARAAVAAAIVWVVGSAPVLFQALRS